MSTPNNNRPRRNAAAGEQVPHSGIHHDERPVREFDNTPLSDAPIAHELPEGVTTEHLPSDLRVGGEEEQKSKKGLMIGAGTGLAALALGGALFAGLGRGGSSNNTAPRTETGTSAPATPTPEATPSAAATVNPDLYKGRVNPETLVNMTPEQLVKAAQITPADAPTPQKYAELVIQKLDMWANAGMTPKELAQFPAATNPMGYAPAMQAKYDTAFGEGLFGFNKDHPGQAMAIAQNHKVFLRRYQLAKGIGQSDYNIRITYEKAFVTSSQPASVDIQITGVLSDNLGEGLNDPNLKPISNTGILDVTMRDWNNDGTYDLQINSSTLYPTGQGGLPIIN